MYSEVLLIVIIPSSKLNVMFEQIIVGPTYGKYYDLRLTGLYLQCLGCYVCSAERFQVFTRNIDDSIDIDRVKRGEMTGIGNMTRSLVFICTVCISHVYCGSNKSRLKTCCL